MHELSIAQSLIDLLTERLIDAPPARVGRIDLSIGRLSGVEPAALATAFAVAAKDTLLDGATLHIQEVSPTLWCDSCQCEVNAQSIQRLRCAQCDTPSSAIRRGRELQVDRIEIFDEDPLHAATNPGCSDENSEEK